DPYSGVLKTSNGTFYATTLYGWTGLCSDGFSLGCGTVFSLNASGVETAVYNFQKPPDGSYPLGTLVRDSSGNLYGTTKLGGTHNKGAVFKVTPSGKGTVLYSFSGSDGEIPIGTARDKAGNLYGVTELGGANTLGTVFKLSSSGTLTVLHNFAGPDGAEPVAGVILDASGNLYGTTSKGGKMPVCHPPGGCGTVFKIDTAGNYTMLHAFTGPPDGAFAFAGLVRDS